MQQQLSSQTREEIDRSQREFFLRQQLRTIQEELGEGDSLGEEISAYRRQIEDSDLSDEASAEIEKADEQVPVYEISNYINAMGEGLRRLKELPVSKRLVREIHERLMRDVRGGHAVQTPG